MTATATMNGKPQRKQLVDQLDRLDNIIDALADGLPGAVADACRDGARLAVKDAILEIISNPELRALLAPPAPLMTAPPMPIPSPEASAPMEPKPSIWSRIKAKVTAAKEAILAAVSQAKEESVGRCKTVRDTVTAIGHASGEVVPVRRILLIALGVGLVAGVGGLIIPQTMAAAVGAVGVATTAISIQAGSWLRRAARRVGLLA